MHEQFGPEHAVLAGAVSTYSARGIIQDLGKALGLPKEDLRALSRQLHSHDAADLRAEMMALPAFRERTSMHRAGARSSSWGRSSCTRPAAWASTWAAWC